MNHRLGNQIADFKENPDNYRHHTFEHALTAFGRYLLDHCDDEAFVHIGMDRAIDLLDLRERRRELPDLKTALKVLEELPEEEAISYGISKLKRAIERLEYEGENDGDQ